MCENITRHSCSSELWLCVKNGNDKNRGAQCLHPWPHSYKIIPNHFFMLLRCKCVETTLLNLNVTLDVFPSCVASADCARYDNCTQLFVESAGRDTKVQPRRFYLLAVRRLWLMAAKWMLTCVQPCSTLNEAREDWSTWSITLTCSQSLLSAFKKNSQSFS